MREHHPVDPAAAAEPARVGQWEIITAQIECAATHVALLPTNQVFAFGGSSLDPVAFENPPPAEILDLETLTTRKIGMAGVNGDLWCGGHTFLPDGRLLFVGGTSYYPKGADPFYGGLQEAYTYDPFNEYWERLDDMREGRWYPTLLRLADNSVLVISGLKYRDPAQPSREKERVPDLQELYHPDYGWSTMAERRKFPLYPRLHLLPNGDAFYSGVFNTHYFIPGRFPSARWSPQTQRWETVGGQHKHRNREEGISALLALRPPDYVARVLVAGGGSHNLYRTLLNFLSAVGLEGLIELFRSNQALDSVELLDLGPANPRWQPRTRMHYPRIHANGVLLPDGQLLVVGGMSRHAHGETKLEAKHAVHHAEMYDPASDIWTVMAAQERDRIYHSTALLLPDGRVASLGSNPHRGEIEHSIELFSPPYLFRGDRPVIGEHPEQLAYGQTFSIETTQARQIAQAVLMRPEVLTHVTNTDQRLLELNFTVSNDTRLEIQGPVDAAHMPQGYCMLFVLNDAGVPSVGRFVQVL